MGTITNELMEKQVALEALMQGHGQDRYWSQTRKAQEKGQESGTKYGKKLITAAIEPTSEAITAFLDSGAGKAGRKHVALKYLRQLDADTAAFIISRILIDGVTREFLLQRCAMAIAAALEQEVRYRTFEQEKKPLFKALQRSVADATSNRHKAAVLTRSANYHGISHTPWPTQDKLHLGQKCVELFIAATGFVETYSSATGRVVHSKKQNARTSVYKLRATRRLMEWIDDRNARCEMLAPVHLPCVIPPRDWVHPFSGGYHTNAIPQLKLVKTSKEGYLEELRNRVDEMPLLYDTVNALQHTAWKVNNSVLEVVRTVWDQDSSIAGLPPRDDLPLPSQPDLDLSKAAREEWTEEQTTTWKSWKREASKIHAFNATIRSQRLHVAKTLWIAETYQDEDAMYFPYQYDFRGRVYAVPYYLTPQGTDLAKGLLTFAEGKPIETQDQADWLGIHGANLYGYDKVSLADRVAWAEEHTAEVMSIADDPFSSDLWQQADKPWQFLAWCYEWAGFKREGFGFKSTLPVAMDGSCNGIQIFSLVLRDEVGGKATNLLPSEQPADIYQTVANRVVEKLKWYSINGQEKKDKNGNVAYHEQLLASEWLDYGIDRKCTKRPVMVVPYGGQLYSTRQYIEDYIKERGDHPWGDDIYPAKNFMANLVWDSISETVIAARQCMDWLQKCAKVAAREELPVTWTTPDGFPVLQAYPELNSKRVKTQLGDSVIKLSLREENHDKVDKLRQQNGISPNWVHSLDGCALRVTVGKAVERGIDAFAMVHDSYATHAADAPTLASTLREAFVETFTEHDVLGDFREYVTALVGPGKATDLPDIPESGSLEINKVLESPFFFA